MGTATVVLKTCDNYVWSLHAGWLGLGWDHHDRNFRKDSMLFNLEALQHVKVQSAKSASLAALVAVT